MCIAMHDFRSLDTFPVRQYVDPVGIFPTNNPFGSVCIAKRVEKGLLSLHGYQPTMGNFIIHFFHTISVI